jgi:hypothetical protein
VASSFLGVLRRFDIILIDLESLIFTSFKSDLLSENNATSDPETSAEKTNKIAMVNIPANIILLMY